MSPMSNAQKQQRYRERKRQAKDARDKLIIGARLEALNSKQRAIAAAALSAVSDILTAEQRERRP